MIENGSILKPLLSIIIEFLKLKLPRPLLSFGVGPENGVVAAHYSSRNSSPVTLRRSSIYMM